MNTIIAYVEQMAENYRDYMLEYINSHQDEVSVEEHADDLMNLAFALKRLTSRDVGVQLSALRKEFSEGYTMMMMDPEHFDSLETWSIDGEDYRVVVFRADGSPVGVINKSEMTW